MLGFLGTIFVGMAAYVQRDPVSFVATHQLELPTNDAKAEARAYYAGTLLPLGLLWLAAAVDSSVVPSAAAAKLTDDEDEGDREDAAGGVRRRLAGFSAAGAAKRRRGATPTPRGRRRGKAAQAASSDGSSSDDGDNGGDDDDSGITDDTRDGPSPLANVSVVPRRLGLAVGVGVLWTFCYQRFVALAHDGRPTQQAQLLQLGEFLGGAVCFVAWLGETAHARGTFVWKMLRKTLRDMVHHSADPAEPLVSFGITGLLWLALYVWTPTYTRVTSIAAAGAIVARSMLGYVATYGSAWYVFEKLHVDKPHKFGPRYHNDGLHKKEWMRWASACLIGALWDVFLSWLWTRGYLQTPPEAASANAAPSEAFSGYFAAYSWAALPRILGVILLADLHFYSVHRKLARCSRTPRGVGVPASCVELARWVGSPSACMSLPPNAVPRAHL